MVWASPACSSRSTGGTPGPNPRTPGWSARNCVGVSEPRRRPDNCQPQGRPDRNTAVVLRKRPGVRRRSGSGLRARRGANGTFSWSNGSRLYYANLTANFSAIARNEQNFRGAKPLPSPDGRRRRRLPRTTKNAWLPPVIVVEAELCALLGQGADLGRQRVIQPLSSATCTSATPRSEASAARPSPILLARSTDAGDTWDVRQITPAANTGNARRTAAARDAAFELTATASSTSSGKARQERSRIRRSSTRPN